MASDARKVGRGYIRRMPDTAPAMREPESAAFDACLNVNTHPSPIRPGKTCRSSSKCFVTLAGSGASCLAIV
jgi:hypothetical protein